MPTTRGDYDGPERRRVSRTAESEEFYEILDTYDRRLVALEERTSDSARADFVSAAAEQVFKSVYEEVGKAVLRAAMYVCGLGVAILGAWLYATGKVRVGSVEQGLYQFVMLVNQGAETWIS